MNTHDPPPYLSKILLLSLFGVAMGYFEASVVVYLRELFYPDGFAFPLKDIKEKLLLVELFREISTLAMLVAVAAIAGRYFWERFGFFILIFGVWDIFYYIWLKATINWPASLLDWDILFLIPAPWIGPVIAPVSVSVIMIVTGILITRLFHQGRRFRPTVVTWTLAIAATMMILFSFMRDFEAMYKAQMPQPYLYGLLVAGLSLYIIAFLLSCMRASKSNQA